MTRDNDVETPLDPSTTLIGIDWGTTSLRVYQIGPDGDVISTRRSDRGLMSVEAGQFASTLIAAAGDWLSPQLPVVASGMVSSKQGWHEVPYLACPADLSQLGSALAPITMDNGVTVHLVPGMICERADQLPDVMRGEECQLAGVTDTGRQVVILPGTHSKWALLNQGTIETFSTIMTGELFGVLSHHSILGKMMTSREHDADAFINGVNRARTHGGKILDQLFGARTLALTERLTEHQTASWLSGLLIGAEIADRALADDVTGVCLRSTNTVSIVGDGALVSRYRDALAQFGIETLMVGHNAAAAGQLRIARAANLL